MALLLHITCPSLLSDNRFHFLRNKKSQAVLLFHEIWQHIKRMKQWHHVTCHPFLRTIKRSADSIYRQQIRLSHTHKTSKMNSGAQLRVSINLADALNINSRWAQVPCVKWMVSAREGARAQGLVPSNLNTDVLHGILRKWNVCLQRSL